MPFCFIMFKKLNQPNGIHYFPHTVEGVHKSYFLGFWRCKVGLFRFNAVSIALKLVTQNKIVFRDGTRSCLPRSKCKRNVRCVVVTDLFVLVNVSTMKVRCSLFMAANTKKVQFMAAKEIKNNSVIEKQSKMALYKKMALYVLFGKQKHSFVSFFICLLFNLQVCQSILPDPV